MRQRVPEFTQGTLMGWVPVWVPGSSWTFVFPSSPNRRKHVAALLDIRGLRNTAARQEILAVARDLELSESGALPPSRDRAFFADIPVPRTSFCLGLPLLLGRLPVSRLARPNLACLPLRPRPPSPVRARADR